MVSFDGRVILPYETQLCVYFFASTVLLVALSVFVLSFVLWFKLQSVMRCDCQRLEGRKQR